MVLLEFEFVATWTSLTWKLNPVSRCSSSFICLASTGELVSGFEIPQEQTEWMGGVRKRGEITRRRMDQRAPGNIYTFVCACVLTRNQMLKQMLFSQSDADKGGVGRVKFDVKVMKSERRKEGEKKCAPLNFKLGDVKWLRKRKSRRSKVKAICREVGGRIKKGKTKKKKTSNRGAVDAGQADKWF